MTAKLQLARPTPEQERSFSAGALMREPGDDSYESQLASQYAERSARVFVKSSASDIFAPLPPVPWLVKDLDMCPGPCCMIAGDGYTRKTISAQSMAVSVATGRKVWGWFGCRQGKVLHVDHEQGRRLTFERYQRLTVGMGADAAELDGQLDVVVLPEIYLEDRDAEDVYTRECEGYALVVVDSFRASAPNADENDSQVRRLLDVFMRVSEKTGVVALVLDHARKPTEGQKGGAKASVRGSGAKNQALSSLLVFEADEGKPTLVHHVKARTSGICAEPFYLDTKDVLIGSNPRAGLVVECKTVEQVEPPELPGEKFREVAGRIVEIIRAEPGISIRKLRVMAGCRATMADAVVEELINTGKIRNDGHGTRSSLSLV